MNYARCKWPCFAWIKCHDGFSNLHLFKQINIDLIFTDCILYLLHRGCTFLYARSTHLATRRTIWQTITVGNKEGREKGRGGGGIGPSTDRIINEIRRTGLETSLMLSQCNIALENILTIILINIIIIMSCEKKRNDTNRRANVTI